MQPYHRSLPSVLALIPARGGSKGVPRKNNRSLCGRPLVEYTCHCALASETIDRTIVSTDCDQIAQVARETGVDVPFLRPAALAADASPTIDVVLHALDWLRAAGESLPDFVVLLQPTTPLRQPHDVDAAVRQLAASDADSIVSVSRVPAHFHPDWQLTINEADGLQTAAGRPLADLPTRRQTLSPTFFRNGAIYATRRETLEATRSLYGRHTLAYEMPFETSINIDTLADWDAAEALLKKKELRHEAA